MPVYFPKFIGKFLVGDRVIVLNGYVYSLALKYSVVGL